ncbi:MAG: hypothetical protein COB93_09650 [Sneathiella sp.]|nr:MAG: hypothetical protein COB93_09650 [Sneathiella sp.]
MNNPLAHELHFSPYIPIEWLLGLALLSAVILTLGLWQRGRGTLWRASLLGVFLLLLANPVLISEKRKFIDDIALIILDETDSQKIGGRRAAMQRAYTDLKAKLEAADNLQVETVTVRNNINRLSGDEGGSHIFAARHQALKNISADRIAATVIITDGQLHDIPKPDELDKAEGPIHFLLTGEKNEKDRVLEVVKAPAFGIVNQPLQLVVKVDDFGLTEPIVATRLSVKLDGEVIQTKLAEIGKDVEIELTLHHGGPNFVEVSVDPLDGELTNRNNNTYITINGVRDRLQVLLVSGEPHMGERGWRNILKSDPSVDLVHFTILRPPEKQDSTPITELSLIAFPFRDLFEKRLNDFDLVIFDRYRRRNVLPNSYIRNIADYVKNGGALLEAAGPSFATPLSLYRTPLAEILPGAPTGHVFNEGFVPAISKIGERHPVTALLKSADNGGRDWGRWFRMIEAEAKSGTTLMTGPSEKPLLILEKQGDGRVAQLLSDHAWLWGRGFEGGGPQSELLRRISHWLMKEPELEDEQLSAVVEGNNLVIYRRSLSEETATVTVTDPDGTISSVQLGQTENGAQTGTVPILTSGLHVLEDGDLKSLVAVGALNPRELRDIRATAGKIGPVAKATGGGIRWLNADGLPDLRRTRPGNSQSSDYWFGLRVNENYDVTGYSRQSMVPPLLALLLTLSFLCLGWWREGR